MDRDIGWLFSRGVFSQGPEQHVCASHTRILIVTSQGFDFEAIGGWMARFVAIGRHDDQTWL